MCCVLQVDIVSQMLVNMPIANVRSSVPDLPFTLRGLADTATAISTQGKGGWRTASAAGCMPLAVSRAPQMKSVELIHYVVRYLMRKIMPVMHQLLFTAGMCTAL